MPGLHLRLNGLGQAFDALLHDLFELLLKSELLIPIIQLRFVVGGTHLRLLCFGHFLPDFALHVLVVYPHKFGKVLQEVRNEFLQVVWHPKYERSRLQIGQINKVVFKLLVLLFECRLYLTSDHVQGPVEVLLLLVLIV